MLLLEGFNIRKMKEKTMKDINPAALEALEELTDEEMDKILGAEGVITTISHECNLNTWLFLFTCCS